MATVHKQGRIQRMQGLAKTPLYCLLTNTSQPGGFSESLEPHAGAVIGCIPVKNQFLVTLVTTLTANEFGVLVGGNYYKVIPSTTPVKGMMDLNPKLFVEIELSSANVPKVTSQEVTTSVADVSAVFIVSNLVIPSVPEVNQSGFILGTSIENTNVSYIIQSVHSFSDQPGSKISITSNKLYLNLLVEI